MSLGDTFDAAVELLRVIWSLATFPFRLCGMLVNAAASLTQRLVRGLLQLLFAMFGLALFCWLGFAFARVLFHPLFV